MAETVGAFLKQKLANLAGWVTAEVGKENLPLDIVQAAQARTELEVTVLATMIAERPHVALHSDWGGLVRLLEHPDMPPEVPAIVQAVRAREDMHEKFWRYVCLFRDTIISNSESE